MEKKELRFSLKTIKMIILLSFAVPAAYIVLYFLVGATQVPDFDMLTDYVFSSEFLSFLIIYYIILGIDLCYSLYQRKHNILEFGSYGFQVKGIAYSYDQVSRLVTVRRRYRRSVRISYHLYVGEEVVFRFSKNYDNFDEFINLLVKNQVEMKL